MKLVRLRFGHAPLAELRVIPFPESGVSVIVAEVKDPVTVPAISIEEIHRLMTLVLRKALGNLGITGIIELEVDLIVRLDPYVHRVRGSKIQRHTALFECSNSVGDPGVRPVRQLVLISVDVQRESLFRHVQRLIRRCRFRRNRRAFTPAVKRVKSHELEIPEDGGQ